MTTATTRRFAIARGGRAAAAICVACLVAMPASTHAQTAEAETLFREGKRLLKKGALAEACEKFEASERLEPVVGTELNLADCREKLGQLASAWAMFVKAAASAKRSDNDGRRAAEARKRAAALDAHLVYLTIEVPEDNRVDGLVIKRNRTVIDPGLWSQRFPVDPNDYTITAEAPGYEPWTTTVTVKTKDRRVEMPALGKLDARPATPAKRVEREAPEAIDKNPARPTPASPPSAIGMTGRRKTAIAVAGVGLAGVGLGIVFGLYANSVGRSADAICPDASCPDAHAVALNQRARTDALIANIGFVAGGLALAGAATLWLIGGPKPHGERMSLVPAIGRDGAGLVLGGQF